MNKDNTVKREALIDAIDGELLSIYESDSVESLQERRDRIIALVEQALSDKGEYREKYLMACAMLSEEQKHNYNLQGRICRQRDEITMLHKKLSPPQE